jgi:hypothetical protein
MNDMPYVDSKGRVYKYGEFFPSELSFFPYKVSSAYEFFPITEAEAKENGFLWYPTSKQDYQINLYNEEIPDNIKDIEKNIIDKAIECAHKGKCKHECTNAFRVIDTEIDFCKRMNIPLPRLCVNCRHGERLLLRNPPKLYHRKCMKEGCNNEFETSYAPERKEIIYCEQCYNQEVY